MQKFVKLVDLVKNFKTSAYLQKSASIQPRTSLYKFCIVESQNIVFWYLYQNIHFDFFRNLHPGSDQEPWPGQGLDRRCRLEALRHDHQGLQGPRAAGPDHSPPQPRLQRPRRPRGRGGARDGAGSNLRT